MGPGEGQVDLLPAAILGFTIAGFAFAQQSEIGLEFVAFRGAAAALLFAGFDTEEAVRKVKWPITGRVDNIPVAATMIPVVNTMVASGLPAEPLWWSLIAACNCGGNPTRVGSIAVVIALHALCTSTGYQRVQALDRASRNPVLVL